MKNGWTNSTQTQNTFKVEKCTFEFGKNLSGLVLAVSKSWEHLSCSPLESSISETYTVHIFNTIFLYNFCDSVAGCGGLSIVIRNKTCHDTSIYIKKTTFDDNRSGGIGGNILIAADIFQSSNLVHAIKMENVTVRNGVAFFGGGLHLYTGSGISGSEQGNQCNLNVSLILYVLNTNFINNWAVSGGGLYVITLSRVLKLYVAILY